MISRRALAKAYVQLMDEYSSEQLSAAIAPLIKSNKVDVELLSKDISAEILLKKSILTGRLSVAHQPDDKQIEAIKQVLAKALKVNDINFNIIVNEGLIGGFVAETPAGTVDSSVITMLDKLEVA